MARPSVDDRVGASDATNGEVLTRYLLDTTVLIAHLRGDAAVTDALLRLLRDGHSLGTTCVSVAEVERGLQPAERKRAEVLLDRLGFLVATRQAAIRAGRYQAVWARRGTAIHTP
jgi:predicted nucleic acid-binding protein